MNNLLTIGVPAVARATAGTFAECAGVNGGTSGMEISKSAGLGASPSASGSAAAEIPSPDVVLAQTMPQHQSSGTEMWDLTLEEERVDFFSERAMTGAVAHGE